MLYAFHILEDLSRIDLNAVDKEIEVLTDIKGLELASRRLEDNPISAEEVTRQMASTCCSIDQDCIESRGKGALTPVTNTRTNCQFRTDQKFEYKAG